MIWSQLIEIYVPLHVYPTLAAKIKLFQRFQVNSAEEINNCGDNGIPVGFNR